jgi:hypothetical protein
MLLLAVLAAAAASVSARPSKQLLGEESGKLISAMASMVDSKHAAVQSLLSVKADEILHKKQNMHKGKSQLPLAIHMDQHIPTAVALPNPSNPPIILANPSQPTILPTVDIKLTKHDKKGSKHTKLSKHDKFDQHKMDSVMPHVQLPLLSMPNPSQPPMPLPEVVKPSKHEKKALKMHLKMDSKLAKFDHDDKKDKHGKFD